MNYEDSAYQQELNGENNSYVALGSIQPGRILGGHRCRYCVGSTLFRVRPHRWNDGFLTAMLRCDMARTNLVSLLAEYFRVLHSAQLDYFQADRALNIAQKRLDDISLCLHSQCHHPSPVISPRSPAKHKSPKRHSRKALARVSNRG